VKLTEHNRIELVWVLGHVGIDGNETADQLARQISAIPLTGPEPSLGVSAKVVRGLIRDNGQETPGALAVHRWTKAT
jgi:hypothetical protein